MYFLLIRSMHIIAQKIIINNKVNINKVMNIFSLGHSKFSFLWWHWFSSKICDLSQSFFAGMLLALTTLHIFLQGKTPLKISPCCIFMALLTDRCCRSGICENQLHHQIDPQMVTAQYSEKHELCCQLCHNAALKR